MTTHSPTIGAIAKALHKAQGILKPALKDSTNPHFRSKYADLQSVWEAARPALQASELALVQGFQPGNGESLTVSTTLLHSSGEFITSEMTLKPQKADPQGIGSAATYGRRYGLAAILGIVADEDDDGNAASGRNAAGTEMPKATAGYARTLVVDRPASGESFENAAPVAATRPITVPRDPVPANGSGWRNVTVPRFIKQYAGKTVSDMDQNDLEYWAAAYKPKPWNGVIQPGDQAFRDALDAWLKEQATPIGAASRGGAMDEDVPF